jgi:hypothetical protein
MLGQLPGFTFLMLGLSLAGGLLASQNLTAEFNGTPSESLLTARLAAKPADANPEMTISTWDETAIVRPNPGSGFSNLPVSPTHPPGSGVASPLALQSKPKNQQTFPLIAFGPKTVIPRTTTPGTTSPSVIVGASLPTTSDPSSSAQPLVPTGLYFPWWMNEQQYLQGGVPAPKRPPSAK